MKIELSKLCQSTRNLSERKSFIERENVVFCSILKTGVNTIHIIHTEKVRYSDIIQ